MKFIYTDQAKEYLKSKNIEDLYIWPAYNGGMCLGVINIRLEISEIAKDDRFFIRDWYEGINTNYDPTINLYKRSSPEITITAFGIGKFKKLVTITEFTSVRLD